MDYELSFRSWNNSRDYQMKLAEEQYQYELNRMKSIHSIYPPGGLLNMIEPKDCINKKLLLL